MAKNPFEETATAGGIPGYGDIAPTYEGESPLFSQGLLDVRYPVDHSVKRAYNYPSSRQPLLNQPPMAGPPQPRQRPHVNPRMRGMGGGLGGMQEQAGLWQDIKRILQRTKNPGPLIDQWTDHWNKYASDDTGIGSLDEYQMAELRQGQKDYMGEYLNTPDFGNVSKQEMWDRVQGMTEGPGFWGGLFGAEGQEPPTEEEFEDYYKQLKLGNEGSWQT